MPRHLTLGLAKSPFFTLQIPPLPDPLYLTVLLSFVNMSSPLYRPAVYSAEQFARCPPRQRDPVTSGYTMSNMFSGRKYPVHAQDPVSYTSTRYDNIPDRFVLCRK